MRRDAILVAVVLLSSAAAVAVSAGNSDDFHINWTVKGWAVVATNNSSMVEETSATMNGYLINDSGALCSYAFEYDTVSGEPYAFSTVFVGAIGSGTHFSKGVNGLTQGELYFFRAKCQNINGTSFGGEKEFLTKPNEPTNLTVRRNASILQLDLSYQKGLGADKTVIVRKVGSAPVNRSDGLTVYNGTSNHYEDGNVTAGQHYFYRAWEWCSEGGLSQWSDNFDEGDCIALTPPTFDIRNIVVVDSTASHIVVTVDVENRGDTMTDITVLWQLTAVGSGAVLDSGSDTFAVNGHSVVTHTINASTYYVGWVNISFHGAGASAFEIFLTRTSGGGGGGGGVTPPPPTPGGGNQTQPPTIVVSGDVYILVFFFIIIVVVIIIILFLKRRKKDKD